MLKYIDALIPLAAGIALIFFPQAFTKKDLNAEDNKPLKKRLSLFGVMGIIAGVLLLLSELFTK